MGNSVSGTNRVFIALVKVADRSQPRPESGVPHPRRSGHRMPSATALRPERVSPEASPRPRTATLGRGPTDAPPPTLPSLPFDDHSASLSMSIRWDDMGRPIPATSLDLPPVDPEWDNTPVGKQAASPEPGTKPTGVTLHGIDEHPVNGEQPPQATDRPESARTDERADATAQPPNRPLPPTGPFTVEALPVPRAVSFNLAGKAVEVSTHKPLAKPKVGGRRHQEASWRDRLNGGAGLLPFKVRVDPAPPPQASLEIRGMDNPLLGKTVENGVKQYRFGNRPLFEPYPHGDVRPEGPKPAKRLIGAGNFNRVEARQNPEASVYVKSSTKSIGAERMREQATTLNQIHSVLSGPRAEPYKGHFAVEILKHRREGGRQAVFLTPKVNGFSLEDYLRDPGRYARRLPPENFLALSGDLAKAILWLEQQGWTHGDIKNDNIMYDEVTRKLVLIDFQGARPAGQYPITEDLDILNAACATVNAFMDPRPATGARTKYPEAG